MVGRFWQIHYILLTYSTGPPWLCIGLNFCSCRKSWLYLYVFSVFFEHCKFHQYLILYCLLSSLLWLMNELPRSPHIFSKTIINQDIRKENEALSLRMQKLSGSCPLHMPQQTKRGLRTDQMSMKANWIIIRGKRAKLNESLPSVWCWVGLIDEYEGKMSFY
jgi:hypothetical protein